MAALTPPRDAARLVVVGGGITGLAAAHRWVETAGSQARSVVVLEAGDRAGGQIRTERQAGFLVEGGPDALVAQKPAGIALCTRLALGPELIDLAGRNPGTQIYRAGRLHAVPDGFLMMAPTRLLPAFRSSLFSWPGKVRMALEPFVSRRAAEVDDESLASFVTRRYGREVLERIAEPVMAGLFTADADRLSLRMTMPRFLDLEAKEGSVTRGLRAATSPGRGRPFGHGTGRGGFVAISGGLTRLVESLIARLPAGAVRLGAGVDRVSQAPGTAGWDVRLLNGETLRASAVLVACPAEPAACALDAFDAKLAQSLRGLRYASCATVSIAYRKEDVGASLSGLGFFVPRTEGLPILACSYVTEKFAGRAPDGIALFRTFLGGATRPHALDAGDDVLVRETHEALRRVLEVRGEPVFAKAYRSPNAMPQFDVGSSVTIASIRDGAASHPGLYVAGSIAGAYGLPDCIRSGEDAADRAAASPAEAYGVADEAAGEPGSSEWVAYQANQ